MRVHRNLFGTDGEDKIDASEIASKKGQGYYTQDFLDKECPHATVVFGTNDFNDYVGITGSFLLTSSPYINGPSSSMYGIITIISRFSNTQFQVVHNHQNRMWRRVFWQGNWTDWIEF